MITLILVVKKICSELDTCISSILQNTSELPFQLEILLSGIDEWPVYYTDLILNHYGSPFSVKIHQQESGFAEGINKIIHEATSEYIVLVDSDAVVTYKWLVNLTEALNSDDTLAAVGPMTNVAFSNQIVSVAYKNMEELVRYSVHLSATESNIYHTTYLDNFVIALRKKAVVEAGLLNTNLSMPFMIYKDLYCKLVISGYKLGIAQNVFVHRLYFENESMILKSRTSELLDDLYYFNEYWGFYPIIDEQMDTTFYTVFANNEVNRILDIGCYTGEYSLRLKSLLHCDITGVSMNEHAGKIANLVLDEVIDRQQVESIDVANYEMLSLNRTVQYDGALLNLLKKITHSFDGKICANIDNSQYSIKLLSAFDEKQGFRDRLINVFYHKHLTSLTLTEIIEFFGLIGYSIEKIIPVIGEINVNTSNLSKEISPLLAKYGYSFSQFPLEQLSMIKSFFVITSPNKLGNI